MSGPMPRCACALAPLPPPTGPTVPASSNQDQPKEQTMEWNHGRFMIDQADLNTALEAADTAAEELTDALNDRPFGENPEDSWRDWTEHRIEVINMLARVAQAKEARALRLSLLHQAQIHEDNADRRADR